MRSENRSLGGKRWVALIASICTLGSLAVAPAANAAGTDAPAAETSVSTNTTVKAQVDDQQCVAVSTTENPDDFKLTTNDDGTVTVGGFADGFADANSCYNLTIGENVSVIGKEAFKEQPIHTLTFAGGDDVSTPLKIEDKAFYDVTGLTSLDLPARLQSGDGSMGGREFGSITSLASVKFSPKSQITSLTGSSFSFGMRPGLNEIVLPPKLTTLKGTTFNNTAIDMSRVTWPTKSSSLYIEDFLGGYNTGTVTFPDNLKSITIGGNSFGGTLSGVKFPDEMDSLSIGYAAFSIVAGAVEVTLPRTVGSLSISPSAFSDKIRGDKESKGTSAKILLPEQVKSIVDLLPAYDGNVYVVPDAVKNSADYWSRYIIGGGDDRPVNIHDEHGNPVTVPDSMRMRVNISTTGAVEGSDVKAYTDPVNDAPPYTLVAPEAPAETPDASEILKATNQAVNPNSIYEVSFDKWELKYPEGANVTGDYEQGWGGYRYVQPGGKLETNEGGTYTWVAKWKVKEFYSISYTGLPDGVTLPNDAPTKYASSSFNLPTPSGEVKGLTFAGWTWTSDFNCVTSSLSAGCVDQKTPVTTWSNQVGYSGMVLGNVSLVAHYTPDAGVTASVKPVTLSFTEGEAPSNVPSEVAVEYSDGSSVVATRRVVVSWKDLPSDWKTLKAGSYEYTGTLADSDITESASLKVTVVKKSSGGSSSGGSSTPSYSSGLTVAYKPTKTEYKIGEQFDATGMVVKYQGHVLGSDQYTVAFDSSKPGKVRAYITLDSDPSKATTVEVMVVVSDVTVHRLYNKRSGEHFYTADENEFRVLSKSGSWRVEGTAFTMADYGTPVYRLYRPGGKHLLTADGNERDVLRANGWRYEGVAFFVRDDGGAATKVHRLYDRRSGDHLLTANGVERTVLTLVGWRDEGVAFTAK